MRQMNTVTVNPSVRRFRLRVAISIRTTAVARLPMTKVPPKPSDTHASLFHRVVRLDAHYDSDMDHDPLLSQEIWEDVGPGDSYSCQRDDRRPNVCILQGITSLLSCHQSKVYV